MGDVDSPSAGFKSTERLNCATGRVTFCGGSPAKASPFLTVAFCRQPLDSARFFLPAPSGHDVGGVIKKTTPDPDFSESGVAREQNLPRCGGGDLCEHLPAPEQIDYTKFVVFARAHYIIFQGAGKQFLFEDGPC